MQTKAQVGRSLHLDLFSASLSLLLSKSVSLQLPRHQTWKWKVMESFPPGQRHANVQLLSTRASTLHRQTSKIQVQTSPRNPLPATPETAPVPRGTRARMPPWHGSASINSVRTGGTKWRLGGLAVPLVLQFTENRLGLIEREG